MSTTDIHLLDRSMRDDRLVSIFIGDDLKPLLIQQSIICAASPFFKTAFTGDFEEAKKGILLLPEGDLEGWHIFIHWLLRGNIPHGHGLSVIKAWTLGDKYDIPQLQDDNMFELLEEFDQNERKSLEGIEKAFAMCPPGSLVRKFLADQVVMFTGGGTRYMSFEAMANLMSWEDFGPVLEDAGSCKDILEALIRRRRDRDRDGMWNWKRGDNGAGKPVWLRYMVTEGGPSQKEFHGWLNSSSGWIKVY